jgi:2',3'-cyclic-nucleotide 2'-phosphodiesterase (5'-nucleotidase family)
MLNVFNSLNVDVATLGNHDFDFGISDLENLIKKTSCKWVLSNMIDKETKKFFKGV